MSSFFLTTAIDYVNSRPHLGTAYEKITADVIARYHRLKGDRTWFLMGNDEHSQNVFKRAHEQGKDPLAYCDEMEAIFREVWGRLDISFDDFIRTTDRRRHFPAVQAMAQACLDNGDIYEGTYEGFYCVGCEEFKPEKDLVEGLCPIHKTKPEWIKERNWFFRLSKYQQPLLDFYAAHPSFIEPEVRRNEILRFVEGGLDDLSMSRAGSRGASRCRSIRRAWSTSGSTPSSTTPRRSASVGTRPASRNGGRPVCTSSARTSRGSTASSGRRC
jgi:methionyl-tRNA synthetase